MSEKFCLQWNDFKENIHAAFGRLRDDTEFADVTLVCEDGQLVEAHKVILAASSPVFQKILQEAKHPRPLVYLKGFQLEHLQTILDFLYFGEANVNNKDLESFLAIAEELKLKGLKGETSTDVVKEEKEVCADSKPIMKIKSGKLKNDPNNDAVENISSDVAISDGPDVERRSLDEKVTSMMEKSNNMIQNGRLSKWGTIVQKKAYICKVCGKEGQVGNIRNHIEANHMEGIAVPCAICEKEFSTRKALQHHKSRYHTPKYQKI